MHSRMLVNQTCDRSFGLCHRWQSLEVSVGCCQGVGKVKAIGEQMTDEHKMAFVTVAIASELKMLTTGYAWIRWTIKGLL